MNTSIILLQANDNAQQLAAELFLEHDPWGFGMTIIGASIVFGSLTILYFIFNFIAQSYIKNAQRHALKKEGKIVAVDQIQNDTSGELNAAIAMGLYLYSSQLHDMESMKLTINRVSKNYSPWSSKIYTLRQWPVIRRKN